LSRTIFVRGNTDERAAVQRALSLEQAPIDAQMPDRMLRLPK
jgi:hypothetical protein